ncbi:TPA: hypothetical protein ACNIQM_001853 [Citrobacter werkmanii]
MENENINTEIKNKAPAVGGIGRSALAQAVLRATNRQQAKEGEPGIPEGDGKPSGEPEEIAIGITDDSTTTQGGAEPGEEGDEVEFYEFSGTKYTPEQVETALRELENNQRYNQSVAPLADSVNEHGEKFERAMLLAATECDKEIEQLEARLASGKLTSQQYQAAHMQLRDARGRKRELEAIANEEKTLRDNAINQTRKHNAKQTVMALTKAGWKREHIIAVDALAKKVMPETAYADAISPAFMEIMRDALIYRAGREEAAKKLQKKTTTALKTPRTQPKAEQPQAKRGLSFGEKVWGDKYK